MKQNSCIDKSGFTKVNSTQPSDYIGESAPTKELRRQLEFNKFEDMGMPSFFRGPQGVGKSILSQIAHSISAYVKDRIIYLAINAGAIQENLIESELFGQIRSSFTGAEHDRLGCFRRCEEGTLFIDEIGSMSKAVQNKTLTAIETRDVKPLGCDGTFKVNTNFHFATNSNMQQMVSDGTFRSDLLSRISGYIEYVILPLCERKDDIPALVDYYVEHFRKGYNLHFKIHIHPNFYNKLYSYDFPGNVRDLCKIIRTSVYNLKFLREKRYLDADDIVFPSYLSTFQNPVVLPVGYEKMTMNELALNLIIQQLDEAQKSALLNGNKIVNYLLDLNKLYDDLICYEMKTTGCTATVAKMFNVSREVINARFPKRSA